MAGYEDLIMHELKCLRSEVAELRAYITGELKMPAVPDLVQEDLTKPTEPQAYPIVDPKEF